jgi:VanZ family protein
MKKFLKYWGIVVLWMGIIFTFSAIPNLKTELEQDFLLRKIAHMVEFGILTFLLYRAIKNNGYKNNKAIIYSLIIALFYAFSDELHQLFVRGRHCSLKDVAIDSIGIFIFSIACYYKNKRTNNQFF